MRGLLAKSVHEVWRTTLLVGFTLLAFTSLLTYILPEFADGFDEIFEEIPLLRSMVSALLGTELGDRLTARAMGTFVWVHPVVLALVWAHEVALCTRMPAGEIDRGTIDVLMGLPVSRRAVYCCETIVWLASGVFVVMMALGGYVLASPQMPEEMRPELSRILMVIINLFGVYVAVGGIAFVVSAAGNRRATAMAVVFGILIVSFLLNFVAQFWEPARGISFLSVMDYYRPAEIIQGGQFPSRDMAILVLLGGSMWLLGGELFARRSICTV